MAEEVKLVDKPKSKKLQGVKLIATVSDLTNLVTGVQYFVNRTTDVIEVREGSWEDAQLQVGLLKVVD